MEKKKLYSFNISNIINILININQPIDIFK